MQSALGSGSSPSLGCLGCRIVFGRSRRSFGCNEWIVRWWWVHVMGARRADEELDGCAGLVSHWSTRPMGHLLIARARTRTVLPSSPRRLVQTLTQPSIHERGAIVKLEHPTRVIQMPGSFFLVRTLFPFTSSYISCHTGNSWC